MCHGGKAAQGQGRAIAGGGQGTPRREGLHLLSVQVFFPELELECHQA